jgi:hypothetical protein
MAGIERRERKNILTQNVPELGYKNIPKQKIIRKKDILSKRERGGIDRAKNYSRK